MAQNFIWYELMTSDPQGAEAFYKAVVGWNSEPFGGSDSSYLIVKAGEVAVGGLMAIPDEAKAMGAQPCWLGYVYAPDVDAATASLQKAGGVVHRAPEDIPNVGRFSVVADPQGAMFMMMTPEGEDGPKLEGSAPGNFGWRELYANDWQAALDFYASQFGWEKGTAVDMGPMGTYQLFNVNGQETGGMMNRPEEVPMPLWMYYINVDAADAAVARVTANGGQVLMPPMEVPGGSWVVQCMDPQGAMFALVAPVK